MVSVLGNHEGAQTCLCFQLKASNREREITKLYHSNKIFWRISTIFDFGSDEKLKYATTKRNGFAKRPQLVPAVDNKTFGSEIRSGFGESGSISIPKITRSITFPGMTVVTKILTWFVLNNETVKLFYIFKRTYFIFSCHLDLNLT